MYRIGGLVTYLCVVVITAHVVTSKPHQCSVDEYAKALLGQYYAAETAAKAVEPAAIAYDYEDARHAPRPGRSNDHQTDDRNGLLTSAAAASDYPAGRQVGVPSQVSTAFDQYFRYTKPDGGQESNAVKDVPSAASPSPSQQQQLTAVNDTSSAAIIEKLAEYYEQLKSQHETLARQQLQHQLYEQQRRRQQEYMLVQQQIQQQYYQQQEHALRMLEQLRKNPGFAGQLAAFIEHKRAEAAANNGTAVPATAARSALNVEEASSELKDQQQWPYGTGDSRAKIERDASSDGDEENCDQQRMDVRVAGQGQIDDADDSSSSSRIDDDQTPPAPAFDEKVYGNDFE